MFPLNVVADVASVKRGLVCFYIRPSRAIAEEDAFSVWIQRTPVAEDKVSGASPQQPCG